MAEQSEQSNLDIWLNNIHQVFGNQPIFLLLKVETRKDNSGKITRCLGVEGIAPSGDSLAFMSNFKQQINPISY